MSLGTSLLVLCSWLSVWSVLVDKCLDVELSDELLDNWVLEVDVGDLDLGLFWDEIHLSLSFLGAYKREKRELKNKITYLFLELERDTSDWSLLNSLHKMCGVT